MVMMGKESGGGSAWLSRRLGKKGPVQVFSRPKAPDPWRVRIDEKSSVPANAPNRIERH
jgi:hypothetical protein